MTTTLGYMELCRLCLVKDKVNVPIFDDTNDVRQVFLKITACLPVKVSRDDSLPKKICDTCLYKIDLLYQFWNTTINAEKQLLQWLSEIGVDAKTVGGSLQMLPQSHAHPHALQEEIMLKEERIEPETKDAAFPNLYTEYPYPTTENNFDTDTGAEEKTAKRKTRGRPAGKKKAKIVLPESDEESIESDPLGNGDPDDSDSDGGKIAKEEADSDEDYEVDNPESLEPTQFVDVPSTADAEQPGPSGLNKSATITAAGTSDQGTLSAKRPLPHARIQVIQLQEGDQRKYYCEICVRQFGDHRQFTIHNRSHTERKYCCSKCTKKFRFPSQLRTHELRHEASIELKCHECNKHFANTDSLILHKRRHLRDYSYHCDECNKGFYNNSAYKTHCEIVHLGVTFTCSQCLKIFKCSYTYNEHVKQHSPDYVKRKYPCDKCDKVYNVATSLKKHIQTIHEKLVINDKIWKPLYMCDICGKSVSTSISLVNHKRIHTGERPYVCQICGKTFKSSEGLSVHDRTHTKIKPYPCTVCDKQFSQRSALVVHARYHTGERPYTCIVCNKKFITLTLMKYHRKTHGVTVEKK